MAAKIENYRMLILVEEALEDQTTITREGENSDNDIAIKSSHEYVDELTLPFGIDEMDILNTWFDKFDEEICIPNEGHIKYEISSDGLIILMLDKEIENVYGKIKMFVEENKDIK